MHQGISGVELNSKGFTLDELLSPDMIPPNVLHAFCGHYHSFKRVNDQITIPGSPMQLNWGDKNESRGWLDVTVDGVNIDIKHIGSKAPKFIEIDTISSVSVEDISHNFLRVTSDTTNQDVTRQSLLEWGAESVEFVGVPSPTGEALNVEFKSYDQLFDKYVKHKKVDD